MCGLGGAWDPSGAAIDPEMTARVSRALAHRGPDASETFTTDGLALVNTRLAIVAPTTARLPVASRDGRWVLAGNGEIYNHRQLAAALPSAARPAAEAGDLAVALAVFAGSGPAGLAELRGPFALAIFDRLRRELWLVRDRWGERPLFHARSGARFLFASELRALEAAEGGARPLGRRALVRFLAAGGLPGDESLLAGVQPVEPGTALRLAADGAHAERFHRSGRLDRAGDLAGHEAAWRAAGAALDRAMDRVLDAEPAVGIAFSGGLDSTSLLLAAKTAGRPVRVYTLAHGDPAHDGNAARARLVARHLGAECTTVSWRLPTPREAFEGLGRWLDGPAGDPLVLHNQALHAAAARDVRVLIGGHGADEVLGGYWRYLAVHRATAPAGPADAGPRWLLSAASGAWPRLATYLAWPALAAELLDPALLEPSVPSPEAELTALLARQPQAAPVDAAQVLDLRLLNAYDNFAVPDENGMANGLEVRSPFFDADLVEAAFTLAPQLRFARGCTKAVLRARLAASVPPSILELPKLGFDDGVDYMAWIRDNLEELLAVLSDVRIGGRPPLRPDAALRLRRDPAFLGRSWPVVWRLFALAAWMNARDRRSSASVAGDGDES